MRPASIIVALVVGLASAAPGTSPAKKRPRPSVLGTLETKTVVTDVALPLYTLSRLW